MGIIYAIKLIVLVGWALITRFQVLPGCKHNVCAGRTLGMSSSSGSLETVHGQGLHFLGHRLGLRMALRVPQSSLAS